MRSRHRRLLVAIAVATPLTGACDMAFSQRPKTDFSGKDALAYAAAQVAFGPRVPGTPAAQKAGDWIIAQMKLRADTVITQEWKHVTQKNETLPLRNILARFKPQAKERILYLTHWDTRPTADEDPVIGKRSGSFDGANDGASGVGLLVAIADLLKKTPPSVGVDLLFVDGEDWGDFNGYDNGEAPDVLIGSTYFASHLPEPGYKPLFGVLFDMIGDADLNMYEESNSLATAPEVVTRVWRTADELGYSKYFIPSDGGAITDDHIPLLKAGLHVIDVIDINYRSPDQQTYHHTTMDTMDKITVRSLQIVGDVATKVLRM
jgi:Zn-dependent M28 family amino/carboxypeptidase